MSEVKVNKISPRSGTEVTLGDSGDTFTIPSGATINNQGTATNFGATGSASWSTTVKTGDFTAVAGEGYFVDTSSGGISVNLPAGVAGAVVAIKDYANTFDTNAVTLNLNGSDKAGGTAVNPVLGEEGIAVTLVFIDSTKGWLVTDSGLQSEAPGPEFITATGGTITTCGNCKVHTFTGPGTFCVSAAGNAAGSNSVDYLVVAGGGGGGIGVGNSYASGGGGAGGMRFSFPNPATGGTPISVQSYPITVGAGGGRGGGSGTNGNNGSNAVAFGVTSAGGGGGASGPGNQGAGNGGSGGGAGYSGQSAGTGNTPPTTPSQGNNGGTSPVSPGPNNPGINAGGGGGGHACVGEPNAAYPTQEGGAGGAGTPLTIAASPSLPGGRVYAGGGAGSQAQPAQNAGVPGGGGAGRPNGSTARNGVVNTGGGGSGGWPCGYGDGGSGVVVIRYKFQ